MTQCAYEQFNTTMVPPGIDPSDVRHSVPQAVV
jgi:hypothetical protein